MSKPKGFAVCKCIFEKNIFLRELKLHVTYRDDKQFLKDYSNKISTIDAALNEAREEASRRVNEANEVIERRDTIRRTYTPLRPDIYTLNSQVFSPEFLSLSHSKKNVTQLGKDLFTFPVFTKEFCTQFISELIYFKEQGIPHRQPNSMNRYGILLDDILGFNDFFNTLRLNYLQPLTRILFPDMQDIELDSHKGKTCT